MVEYWNVGGMEGGVREGGSWNKVYSLEWLVLLRMKGFWMRGKGGEVGNHEWGGGVGRWENWESAPNELSLGSHRRGWRNTGMME